MLEKWLVLCRDLKTVFEKHFLKPTPTNREKIGSTVGLLLSQIKVLEEAQTSLNTSRDGLAQIAFSLKDAGVLSEIERLAAMAPQPKPEEPKIDPRAYDGNEIFDNMFS